MGEGWSDFISLLMIVREADALLPSNPGFTGAYASAPYVFE